MRARACLPRRGDDNLIGGGVSSWAAPNASKAFARCLKRGVLLLGPKRLLAAVALLVTTITLLAAAAKVARADCSGPRDYGELVHCFLAQYPCIEPYLGIDGAPDYPKALQCFESTKNWFFVALMYLNGEGTLRNAEKAAAALNTWEQEKSGRFDRDRTVMTLNKAIGECRQHPRSCSRVDFCDDLAESDREIEICLAVGQCAEEAAMSREIFGTRGELSPADRVLLDRVVTEFKAYQLDDMQREYQASIEASMRDIAGAGQAGFVRQNFRELVAKTVRARGLRAVATRSYDALDGQLNREVSRVLSKRVQAWEEDLRDPGMKAHWDQEKSYIEDYKKAARESQDQWVKFRDSCAELANSLYRSRAGQFDPAVSMKAFVTRLRIAELRYDPIGPESS